MDRDYELQTHQAEDRHWWYRGRRTVLDGVIGGLGLPARARILDAGCGSGRNMVELARHGTVTGVELSEPSVALAREREAGEVIAGSVLEMPFPDDSFDLAVSLDVIEHLEDDLAALTRAAAHGRTRRRAARHGARLSVAVERARRDQPPPPPLHASLASTRRRSGRLAPDAHDTLQLAAAAGRDRAARARPAQHQDDRVEPRLVGSPGTAQLGAASVRSRSRRR